jgi:carbamate kinase
VQLGAIERLVSAGYLVVCAGGGVPVVVDARGRYRGVEAVIDKDLASSLLAIDLGVDTLVLATDVDAVYDGYGQSEQLPIAHATPMALRVRDFPTGSMGPKVEAACRFVERTGRTAAIGSLDQVEEMLAGRAGTQVSMDGPELEHADRGRTPTAAARHARVARQRGSRSPTRSTRPRAASFFDEARNRLHTIKAVLVAALGSGGIR